MISLLAPSKTLDFEHDAPSWVKRTQPLFRSDAEKIVAVLRKMSQHQLGLLMNVSDTIAATNHERLKKWGDQTKPSLWAYRGDVYKGIYADSLTQHHADWAQQHLLIMSGLYGVVRPYDAISPYRLEMKAKLGVAGHKDLYAFWDKQLVEYADSKSNGIICNLSSDEYAKPILKHTTSRIITPVFMDHRPNGSFGAAPIYNKMMRGVMAHWMIVNEVDDPERLREFTGHGYIYDESHSKPNAPAFSRATMTPLVF
jgi:uncharacterized protein